MCSITTRIPGGREVIRRGDRVLGVGRDIKGSHVDRADRVVGRRADLDRVGAARDGDVVGQVAELEARQGIDLGAVDEHVDLRRIRGAMQDADHRLVGCTDRPGHGEGHRSRDGEGGEASETPEISIHDGSP
jgi:hypothetical protein